MSTGGGHSALEEIMSIMGVPVMTKNSFIDTERAIGEMWKQELLQSMAEAGREERQLVMERGEYHEGVPAIAVVVDGGWSKRLKFIGDGNSSVYPTLLQNVPGWGHAIKKLECSNHTCKCYRGAPERLVQDNPSYKGSGRLTLKMRKRLVSSARAAIRMRSQESDVRTALAALKHDLQNGPQHCFGMHQHCSTDFCKTAREKQQQSMPSSSSSSMNTPTNLAESWMRIRTKFDGGKVINRCQSGAWEHRCAWELDYVRTWVWNGVFMHGKI